MTHDSVSQSPVVLLGTHRSGTTWLGSVLSQHPDLAYLEEPRHLWSWGNADLPDERLTAEHARPEVVEHIRNAFEREVERRGKSRLIEKTPSNCLRVPFVRAVYPEATLLLVVRDGRSVIRSTAEIMAGGVPARNALKRAIKTPLRDWPAQTGKVVDMVRQKLTGGSLRFWGARPPGWRDWLEHDHPDVVLAKQWAAMVNCVLDDLAALPPRADGSPAYHMFRYEDAATTPEETLRAIAQYANLDRPEALTGPARESARPDSVHAWRSELDDDTLERIRPHMEPAMNRLGYAWDAEGVTA